MGMQTLSSRAIIGSFYHALEQNLGASWVNAVGMKFTSDQESETYAWLGMSPIMREWVGPRLAKGLRENGITIPNKKWEATLEIPVDWMRRDKTGQIMVRVNDLARRANAHWARLLSSQIVNGESNVCYDGQYFFDTDHAEGDSGAQSNSITYDAVSTSKPTGDEMSSAILSAVEKMFSFVDDQGEPLNEDANRFLIMIPVPFLQATGIALKATVVGATSNQVAATGSLGGFNFDVAVNPRLSSWTTKFAIFRTDGDVAPFILQEEEELTMKAIAEGSELEFTDDVHQYGIKAMRNVGYGFWQKSCLVTFT